MLWLWWATKVEPLHPLNPGEPRFGRTTSYDATLGQLTDGGHLHHRMLYGRTWVRLYMGGGGPPPLGHMRVNIKKKLIKNQWTGAGSFTPWTWVRVTRVNPPYHIGLERGYEWRGSIPMDILSLERGYEWRGSIPMDILSLERGYEWRGSIPISYQSRTWVRVTRVKPMSLAFKFKVDGGMTHVSHTRRIRGIGPCHLYPLSTKWWFELSCPCWMCEFEV